MNLQKLNDAQLKAVTAPLAPTLVLAGAGSGKTRVLTNRILYLVQECGVRPQEILAITFTNKAANEMKRRLYDFHCDAQYMHVSTIHSFCATVLRNDGINLGLKSNFTIYDEEDVKSLLKGCIKDAFEFVDIKQTVKYFANLLSHVRNINAISDNYDLGQLMDNEIIQEDISALSSLIPSATAEQLIDVLNSSIKMIYEDNAVSFDDLLNYTHQLLRKFPNILDKYSERYKYILIDEFQDVSTIQYEIFQMLSEKYRNIFVVGDDDQSIYMWRGADYYNITKFQRDFPDCNVYKLEQNYRSTKRIVEIANAIIDKNQNRIGKKLWTENEDGLKPQWYSAYNERDEAYFVCEQIKNLIYLNNTDYKLRDFAVLMRVNALSRSFEQQFQQNHIPYKVFGGFKFFERKEIKDVLAYMRLIHNPFDSVAFIRALNVPKKRGIGDTSIAKLNGLSLEYGLPLLDVISDERNLEIFNSTTRAKLLDFYALITELRELAQENNVSVFVHKMLDILEFRKVWLELDEDERASNIDEFEQSVMEFQENAPNASLADYLQTVSLSQDVDGENSTDYVTIATIHAVKGLEFKVVFIVGLEENRFPQKRVQHRIGKEEERRLMYVAITRAQKRLYITTAQSRYLFGQKEGEKEKIKPSIFYQEILDFYAPARQPASERDLSDDRYLDKLIRNEPARPAASQGKTDADVKQYRVGQMVEHASFGRGIILRIERDIADVVFESVGKKSLNMKFAPIEIVK